MLTGGGDGAAKNRHNFSRPVWRGEMRLLYFRNLLAFYFLQNLATKTDNASFIQNSMIFLGILFLKTLRKETVDDAIDFKIMKTKFLRHIKKKVLAKSF